MDNIKVQTSLESARVEIEKGNCELAYNLLLPMISENIPEAIFLYSTFSFDQAETLDEFERRSIELLKKSADLNYPPAIYALGVCYDVGDGVEINQDLAASFFEKAANMSYPKAKLFHGLNLYYGSYGVTKDQINGIKYIEQAALDCVDGAEGFLRKLTDKKIS